MADHEARPYVRVQSSADHRAAEAVMKAVLAVAAFAGAALLLYMTFFIGVFALSS
ncbi:hypothetical protein [Streptomyces sp. NPDC048644]|uniref:hypothetical protein n=1 Tax=Streptomyces sp. NPDC048644 TaxID=3365582 RepID=UPI003713B14A